MSSGWLTMLSYVIRIRSLIWWLSHPDDLAGVGISSGWLTVNSLCHPDDIPFHLMSSGWLNWAWYLIRMSYGSVIMSSGWDTLPVLSHPDEIANFDFPHHAVALQRFRTSRIYSSKMTYYRNRCKSVFCKHNAVVWYDLMLVYQEICPQISTRGMFQYKDAILPAYETPLWR